MCRDKIQVMFFQFPTQNNSSPHMQLNGTTIRWKGLRKEGKKKKKQLTARTFESVWKNEQGREEEVNPISTDLVVKMMRTLSLSFLSFKLISLANSLTFYSNFPLSPPVDHSHLIADRSYRPFGTFVFCCFQAEKCLYLS